MKKGSMIGAGKISSAYLRCPLDTLLGAQLPDFTPTYGTSLVPENMTWRVVGPIPL